jgi:hypothetical protein
MASWTEHLHVRDSVSGAFGAACLVAAGAPFDTVKLRVQTGQAASPLACLRSMVATEGVLSLWKGAGPAFSSAVIENTVIFTVNGLFRRLLLQARPDDHEETVAEHALVGAATGVFSSTAICPAEVVKVRMQYQRNGASTTGGGGGGPRFASGWAAARHIYATEGGLRGLFAGLAPLMVRDIPFNAIFFASYRSACSGYRQWAGLRPEQPLPAPATFLAGGLAGVAAWSVVLPADRVKSAMQVAGQVEGHAPTYNATMMSTLRHVLAEGRGVRALYVGWTAAVLRSFPANAALFWGVETADRVLRQAGV